MMVAAWLLISVLLYFPFKKWVATANAPLISALLWPIYLCIIALSIVASLFMNLFHRIKGG